VTLEMHLYSACNRRTTNALDDDDDDDYDDCLYYSIRAKINSLKLKFQKRTLQACI